MTTTIEFPTVSNEQRQELTAYAQRCADAVEPSLSSYDDILKQTIVNYLKAVGFVLELRNALTAMPKDKQIPRYIKSSDTLRRKIIRGLKKDFKHIPTGLEIISVFTQLGETPVFLEELINQDIKYLIPPKVI